MGRCCCNAAGISLLARNSFIICPPFFSSKPYSFANADQLTVWFELQALASSRSFSLSNSTAVCFRRLGVLVALFSVGRFLERFSKLSFFLSLSYVLQLNLLPITSAVSFFLYSVSISFRNSLSIFLFPFNFSALDGLEIRPDFGVLIKTCCIVVPSVCSTSGPTLLRICFPTC